jgi:hypothetical protein
MGGFYRDLVMTDLKDACFLNNIKISFEEDRTRRESVYRITFDGTEDNIKEMQKIMSITLNAYNKIVEKIRAGYFHT